jgi:hypothetical protein
MKISYAGYRFPPEIIQQATWLYLRFTPSLRDVEDLLAERGVTAPCETVRRWVNHFGPMVAADLRKRRPKPHATWRLDEVYLKIDGRMVYRMHPTCAQGGGRRARRRCALGYAATAVDALTAGWRRPFQAQGISSSMRWAG